MFEYKIEENNIEKFHMYLMYKIEVSFLKTFSKNMVLFKNIASNTSIVYTMIFNVIIFQFQKMDEIVLKFLKL